MKGIVLVSGGLDSVTLAYYLKDSGHELHLVSFVYGQRHFREVNYASDCAIDLKSKHSIIALPIGDMLKGSALTDDIEVPEGHYTSPNMAITVVPNRNAIFLSIAYGIAVAEKCNFVAAAMHAGDHPIYPDCRPSFVKAFECMETLATEGYCEPGLSLWTPFVNHSKAEIVKLGHLLGVPYQKTWSCYKGLEDHCGRCGTCVERIEAFQLAKVTDPTLYEGLPV